MTQRLLQRAPDARLRREILGLTAYAAADPPPMRHAAPLRWPLIFNIGAPWHIALAGTPAGTWRRGFAAGLVAGAVVTRAGGAAECVQVDLTPWGAARLLGGAAGALAGQIADLDAVLGPAARALEERLAETADWHARLDLAEAFVAARLAHAPSAEVAAGWRLLAAGARVAEAAARLGWSERHFRARFRAEAGITPGTAGRILRLHRALRLGGAGPGGWAGTAAAAGYADQAHMIREFRALAGTTPARM